MGLKWLQNNSFYADVKKIQWRTPDPLFDGGSQYVTLVPESAAPPYLAFSAKTGRCSLLILSYPTKFSFKIWCTKFN